jgi:hypothetical protein
VLERGVERESPRKSRKGVEETLDGFEESKNQACLGGDLEHQVVWKEERELANFSICFLTFLVAFWSRSEMESEGKEG